jgi:hypothetical protein
MAVVAALGAAFAGCSAGSYDAYPSGSLAPGEAATLRVVEYRQDGAAWNAVIKDVDGKRPPFLFRETQETRTSLAGDATGVGKTITLSPGQHAIRVGIYWDEFPSSSVGNPFNGHCLLEFTARGGETYDLESNYWRTSDDGFSFGSRDWSAQIVDAGTREVVSGGCRPADEL